MASILGPPPKSYRLDGAGSSPERGEHLEDTLRQKVHIGEISYELSCGPLAEGFRRRTLAISLGPPPKSDHFDGGGSSPVRGEHSHTTLRQKVHIG